MPTGFRTIFAAQNQVVLEPQEFSSPGPGQALLRTERTLITHRYSGRQVAEAYQML